MSGVQILLLVVTAILLLANFGRAQNSVWGGATLGIVVGIIVGIIREGFWASLLWSVSIGTFAGFVFDMMGRLSDRASDQ